MSLSLKIKEWQDRPLESVYPIVFIDTVHFSVRDESSVVKKAAYIVLGINEYGEKDVLGIGTYSLTGDTAYNFITSALDSGVRLIDTAYIYGNEEEIGRAIKDSNMPREEIFIITKIYPNQFDNSESAIEMAFEKLDVDYIDMMLLHHPGTNDVKAYKAIERYVEQGKIGSIGLSNWYEKELKEFLPQINIVPALDRNEKHDWY